MKILVPTDFSENAIHAFEFALKVAKLDNSRITLLFSYYTVYDFAAQSEKIVQEIETIAKKALKNEINSKGSHGITVDHEIFHGTVATAVNSTSNKEDYDLIIMGTQGSSGIEKTLIGSNTTYVVKDSKIPVIAVPFGANFEEIKEITVAVESSDDGKEFFTQLMDLTKNWKLTYRALHIERADTGKKDTTLRELEEFLKSKYPGTYFSFTSLPAVNIIEGIDRYFKEVPISLLVMFYKNKTFFEYLFNKSHVVQMAYHTHVPLLVLKS